ncbi:MAG: FKBP-type peptidyl-prolyl cis-trans isomerase, partial [Longimicrobiales bacterium]|nr:FKBP-type peptidyl-prolyl cis-trans isomerase [Longimicrobiales bacterium]
GLVDQRAKDLHLLRHAFGKLPDLAIGGKAETVLFKQGARAQVAVTGPGGLIRPPPDAGNAFRYLAFFAPLNPGFAMRQITLAALAATLFAAGCAPPDTPLVSEDQKASYAFGMDVGTQFQPAGDLLDVDAFMRGFRDAIAGADAALDPLEIQTVMQGFSERVREAQMRTREQDGERNRETGEAFRTENGARAEVTTTASGLQYEVLRPGDGPIPGPNAQVTIHYRGTLVDGTVFDSSYDRGQPATFGVGGVIPGFSEGLQLMPVGSQYRLVIPPELGYGPQGAGADIGPDATLIFEVEMLEIVED